MVCSKEQTTIGPIFLVIYLPFSLLSPRAEFSIQPPIGIIFELRRHLKKQAGNPRGGTRHEPIQYSK